MSQSSSGPTVREVFRPVELLLGAVYAAGLGVLAGTGWDPGYYPPPSDFEYPTFAVLLMAMAMFAEILLLGAIIRPRSYRRSWRRALLVAGLFIPAGLFGLAMTGQSPGYFVTHAMWLFLLGLGALILACVSAVGRWRQRRRARRAAATANANDPDSDA